MNRTIRYLWIVLFAASGLGTDATSANANTPLLPRAGNAGLSVSAPRSEGCDTATPGIIIHDDGVAEDGVAFFAPSTDARFVDKFTPAAYPATFSSVCFAFVSDGPDVSFNFDLVVYAADGAEGAPGTLLGSESFSANAISLTAIPFTPVFESFDITSLALNIASGDIYIGAKWNPTTTPPIYLAEDTPPGTAAGGYGWSNSGPWKPVNVLTGDYKALMIRAVEAAGSNISPPHVSKTFSPASVAPDAPSALTITLTNTNATSALLTEDLIDSFPTGLIVATPAAVSTDCENGTATTSADSVALAAGASIPGSGSCRISVNVSSTNVGTYANVIATGALQTDVGANNTPAEADLVVADVGGGLNGVYHSPALNRTLPIDAVGVHSAINWVSGAFDDSGLITSGDWDLTFSAISSQSDLRFFSIPTYEDRLVLGGNSNNAIALHPGDIVGPSSLFGLGNPDAVWLAGADAYLGFKFKCDGRLLHQVPSTTCYGYAHIVMAGPHGIPTTIVDYSYDGDGNAITVQASAISAPIVAQRFVPVSVSVNAPSTLTITLTNDGTTTSTLISDFIGILPNEVTTASAADTDCPGGVAVANGTTWSLGTGASIPASGSCTINLNVIAAQAGIYTNTIAANSLQTNTGGNATQAQAILRVSTGGAGTNGIYHSPPLNVDVDPAATNRINWASGIIDDEGQGGWDVEFIGIGSPPSLWALSGSLFNNALVVNGAHQAALLHPGDLVGPDSPFYSLSFNVDPIWLAGADAYMGFVFDCDTRLVHPVPPIACYGYVHLKTTAGTGFPATIVDYSYDGDGNSITIVGDTPPHNDPSATVTPSSLSVTTAQNATASTTLTLENAADSAPLTYSIAARGAAAPVARTAISESFKQRVIRARNAGISGICNGPIVDWLGVDPASGSISGGAGTAVTVTANPAANNLAVGTYSAELCLTTNDPAHALISVPVSLTVTEPPIIPCSAADSVFCDGFDRGGPIAQPIVDSSFEATPSDGGINPNWDSLDSNPSAGGSTVFYSASGAGIPVHTGDFAGWFGGWNSGAETQHFSQTVALPNGGPLYLNYWRFVMARPSISSFMTVSVDGIAVQTIDLLTVTDAHFVKQSIDISSYADGEPHALRFEYDYDGSGASDGKTFIDDVTIERDSTSAALPTIR